MKTILLVFCFLATFSVGNLFSESEYNSAPLAEDGILELAGWDFTGNPVIKLDGSWLFAEGVFVDPDSVNLISFSNISKTINVPDIWNNQGYPNYTFGTYFLRILLDEWQENFAMQIPTVSTACKIFINGKEMYHQGSPGKTKETSIPSYHPDAFVVHSELIRSAGFHQKYLDIVIHISNFHHADSGLWESLLFGNANLLMNKWKRLIITTGMLNGILLITSIIFLMFSFLRWDNKISLFFGLYVLSVLIFNLNINIKPIYYFFPSIDFEIQNKMGYLMGFCFQAFTYIWFIHYLFPKELNYKIARILSIPFVLSGLFILFNPLSISSDYKVVFNSITGAAMIFVAFYVLPLAVIRRRQAAAWIMLAAYIQFFAAVNDILMSMEMIHTFYISSYGSFAHVMLQFYGLTLILTDAYKKNKELSIELSVLNKNLERIIERRTEVLNKQKDKLSRQKKELGEMVVELKKMNEFKDSMTSLLVHDMKNSLNVITNLAESDLVKQAGNEIQVLVLNILEVQKFEEAKIRLTVTDFNFKELIDRAVQWVGYIAALKEISVVSWAEEIFVNGDEYLLERVLRNILSNAVRHSEKGSKIIINIEKSKNSVICGVTNKGTPINEEDKELIFEKYTQLASGKDEAMASTGLGLYFCKLVINQHKNKIGVENTKEGTKFWFSLRPGKMGV